MHYMQPKDIRDLRAFCSIIDQERVENMSKAIKYARAYMSLRKACMHGGQVSETIKQEDLQLERENLSLHEVDS